MTRNPTKKRLDLSDPDLSIGPYGIVGATFNVVTCAIFGVGTVLIAIFQQQPAIFMVTMIFGILEIVFVRVLLQARRKARGED